MILYGYKPDPKTPDLLAKDKDFSIQLKPYLVSSSSGDIDLSKYSTPSHQYSLSACFPAGTHVLLDDFTERNIEDISVGNMVRAHDGKSYNVIKTFNRSYSGLLYKVKVQGWAYSLDMTDEHPILVVPNISKRAKYKEFEPGPVSEIQAKDLRPGDFVVIPVCKEIYIKNNLLTTDYISNKDTIINGEWVCNLQSKKGGGIPLNILLNEEFCRLIGLFLAEGSYIKVNGNVSGIMFTFNRNENSLHEFVKNSIFSIFKQEAYINDRINKDSVTDVVCYDVTLANFFYGLCGEYALYKKLSSVFFKASINAKLALLRGWFEGDGSHSLIRTHRFSDGKKRCAASVEGTTSSEQLHRSLSYLAVTCGIKPSTSFRPQEDHQNAPAGLICLYSNDILKVFPNASEIIKDAGINVTGQTWHKTHELGFISRIKSIEVSEVEELPVYNIEVSDVHTYIVNGIAVHNCAGNSTADAVEIVSAIEEEDKAKKENRAPVPVPQLSRLFVYSMARSIMEDDGNGQGQINKDQGTYIRLCFDILSRFGICEESVWPYDTAKVFVPPSIKAMRQAVGHRIHSYYRIKQTGNDRIPEIIAALRGRHPVVFGTQISKKFGNIKAPYVCGIPTDPGGGHAQIIVGWVNGLFKVKNSWGSDWADCGFCYFTPEYIAWNQTQDIWVPTAGTIFS